LNGDPCVSVLRRQDELTDKLRSSLEENEVTRASVVNGALQVTAPRDRDATAGERKLTGVEEHPRQLGRTAIVRR
jgi:hypothetical protein